MKKLAALSIIFLLAISSISAQDVEYTNRSFARLSYITGKTYIQRAADLGFEEAMVNMPVAEGDRLGATDGRAEIYLGSGAYLRLDSHTKIDFMSLPNRGRDLTQIRIWAGSAYFSVHSLSEERNIEIHTADVSLYILDPGIYRVDVRENTETEILVFQGMIEAAGEANSVLVKDAQRLEAINGHFLSNPLRFMAVAEDNFDRWTESRESKIRRRMVRRYLPNELSDFEYELAEYGRWVHVFPYGFVWVPRSVASGWRPYFHGRWLWYHSCGWTWLPYEPWGWATFHFGRWNWRLGIGWYWIPSRTWGPAWVHWHVGYDYYGWAPLGYYDRPGVVVNNRYYYHYTENRYPVHSDALTVVTKDELRAKDISKVAISKDELRKVGSIQLSKDAPKARSIEKNMSIQKTMLSRSQLKAKAASSQKISTKKSEEKPNMSMTTKKSAKVKSTQKSNSKPSQLKSYLTRDKDKIKSTKAQPKKASSPKKSTISKQKSKPKSSSKAKVSAQKSSKKKSSSKKAVSKKSSNKKSSKKKSTKPKVKKKKKKK